MRMAVLFRGKSVLMSRTNYSHKHFSSSWVSRLAGGDKKRILLPILAIIILVAGSIGAVAAVKNNSGAPAGTVELAGISNGIASHAFGGCAPYTRVTKVLPSNLTEVSVPACVPVSQNPLFLVQPRGAIVVSEKNESFDVSFGIVTFGNPGAATVSMNGTASVIYSPTSLAENSNKFVLPNAVTQYISPESAISTNSPFYNTSAVVYFVPAETNASVVFPVMIHNMQPGNYVVEFQLTVNAEHYNNGEPFAQYVAIHLVITP